MNHGLSIGKLQASWNAGKKVAVATITHTLPEGQFVSSLIGQKIFAMARKEELKLPGFPAFEKTVAELQQKSSSQWDAEYQACVALADGTLVVKQALLDMYLTKPEFREETQALLDAHNLEFNPKNLSAGSGPEGDAANGAIATGSLTLDTTEDAEKILNTEGKSLVNFV